ncbi:TniQ family protein [Streptomyces sp. NPDC051563]|uniref:TniQ family protein n=1 Tax=Streptomyces sp. NPDC051563 TaxID=3365659 RepID=UPI0037B9AD9E
MSTSLRRLALVPEPYPGESLLSWVDALARLNRVSRLHALRLAGFARPDVAGYRPSVHFGTYLTATTVARVHVATGLSAGQQHRMTLAHHADGVLPALPSPLHRRTAGIWLARLLLALPARSRACPACLRENGGRWLLRWRLAWSFACVHHHVYLLAACRGCGNGLHQIVPGPADAVVCGQYNHSRREPACPQVISRMRAPRLSDPHLLQCQRRLDRLVDHPHLRGGQDILRSLHVALEDIRIHYDDAPPLPDTDTVLHRRWQGHQGALWYVDDPLLTAALVKIATLGGLGASQDGCRQADTASWSAGGFLPPDTGAPAANRFGSKCRATACAAWVPPGQGCVVHARGLPHVLCPAHARHVTAPGIADLIHRRFV